MDATKRAAKERRDLRMNHPLKNISPAEWDVTGIEDHNVRVMDGAGPDWHPNAIAHRALGMEMYAWIRYTLSL